MSVPKIITWFEIPVMDFDKSKSFYDEVFGLELEVQEMDGKKFGSFPLDPANTNGAIVAGEGYRPSDKGIGIFFEATGTMDVILDRVEPAGGKVIMPRNHVNEEIGDVAAFLDIEGNRIGLHASE